MRKLRKTIQSKRNKFYESKEFFTKDIEIIIKNQTYSGLKNSMNVMRNVIENI